MPASITISSSVSVIPLPHRSWSGDHLRKSYFALAPFQETIFNSVVQPFLAVLKTPISSSISNEKSPFATVHPFYLAAFPAKNCSKNSIGFCGRKKSTPKNSPKASASISSKSPLNFESRVGGSSFSSQPLR